ncbi:MAG: inositol monophosphatase family protein [Gammaproteobacteria bacterium]|nr:inositol monophosphatase [Pseudomonadales bacterium]MCP5348266.1 inositol monophosphatase [Pseudomonadales bacterium]
MPELIEFAKAAAIHAGDLIVRERQQNSLQHDFKNGNELVTQADLKADALITGLIRKTYPGHLILSEELAPDLDNVSRIDGDLWIVDPIDGTVNYAHGHCQSAVSIAHAREGRIDIGVVYNPFTRELFWAESGGGAFLNEQRIEVARESELRRAIIATGFPYDKSTLEPMLERVAKVLRVCADIRRLGSAALDICWVAAGRLDGYYESLSLWDFAAAQVIAIEAGAQYGHFTEVPPEVAPQFHTDGILVANPELFPKLREILRDDVNR